MTDFIRFGDILRTRIHRLPLRFAECIRRNPSVGLTVYAKNVSSTLRSSEAGRRGRRPLPRLSPFSAKPKRRPHFGGEGYSRGQKRIPFLPLTPPPVVEAEKNEARRGCMVGASPKNISSTLRSSETMIAVPSRPSAGWNRWVKKDPFLTYAPLGDPSCANMKQKPCGFHEAPALRASVGASPKDVSSTLRSEIATKAVSSHYRWNETGGSKRIPF